MKIYLASPFFNIKEVEVYKRVIERLRGQEYEVFVPQEHEIENAWDLPNHIWANAVFGMDVAAIHNCDVVVAINWGMYSDSGTAWECGYAYALGKKVVQLVPHYTGEHSLMMISSAYAVASVADFLNYDFETILKCFQETKVMTEQK